VKEIESLIRSRGVSNAVKIRDFNPEIAHLYKNMDVLVIPSVQSESFGLVAVEAMAFKKPVIASSIGALSEIVEDGITGFLVRPNDPISLADAMIKLIDSPVLCSQMGRTGFIRYKKFYSGIQYEKGLNAVVDKLFS